MASSVAAAAKEKGNAAFKAGQWDIAIGQYSAAIVSSGSSPDPTYFLNRAAAYLKLNKYEDAQRDCSSVLKLRPNDVKALFRRAQARIGLADVKGAEEDLGCAAKLEPGNEAVKAELKKLAEREQEKPRPKPPLSSTVKERMPPSAPSAPLRRRIPIDIVDTPASEASSSAPKLKSALRKTSPDATSDLFKPVSTTRLTSTPLAAPAANPSPANQATTAQSPPPATFAAAREAREAKTKKLVGGGFFKKDGSSRIIGSDGVELLHKSKVEEAKVTPPTVAPVVREHAPPASSLWLGPSPKTAAEFTRTFKDISEADRWPYLQRVPSDKLPELFGSALEPDILGSIIKTLSTVPTSSAPLALSYLQDLTKISRFTTNRLFLPPQDVATVSNLLTRLQASSSLKQSWRV